MEERVRAGERERKARERMGERGGDIMRLRAREIEGEPEREGDLERAGPREREERESGREQERGRAGDREIGRESGREI